MLISSIETQTQHYVSQSALSLRTLGIVSAMSEEQAGLLALIDKRASRNLGGRDFHLGQIAGVNIVCVLSGIGKVAAATTATTLITHFNCDALLFTGVAGGVGQGVKVGDAVIGTQFVQHDLDASPLFPRYELPLYGTQILKADEAMSYALVRACEQALPQVAALAEVAALIKHTPQIHQGLVASGDSFVSTREESQALLQALAAANFKPLCVEMEGAGVAQVCHDFGVPFAVLRTISDRADDTAHVDFTRFIKVVASRYSIAVVQAFVNALTAT